MDCGRGQSMPSAILFHERRTGCGVDDLKMGYMLRSDRCTLCFEERIMALVTDDRQCQRERVPSAWIEDGVLKIRDTGKPIPAFLLGAQKALQARHRAEAE